jgi:small-conductance mechanosensitive channel
VELLTLIQFIRYKILFDDSRHRATQGTRKKLLARIEEWVEGAEKFVQVPEDIARQIYKDVTSATIYLPSQLDRSQIKVENLSPLLQQEVEFQIAQLHGLRSQLRGAVKAVNAAEQTKASTARGQRPNTKANAQIRALDHCRDPLLNSHNKALNRLQEISKKMNEDYNEGFTELREQDLHRKWTMGGRQVGDSRRTDGSLWTGAGRADISAGPSSAHLS